MGPDQQFTFAVIITTVLLLVMFALMGVLMVVNTSRRQRHRAEVAELHLLREQEVVKAEREAIQHTLREVGRELHDNVGQLLSVAQMGVHGAVAMDPSPQLQAVNEALGQGIAEVRRLAHSLDSDLWQHRSLKDAIGAEAERLERVGRVKAQLLVIGEPPAQESAVKTILFRTFQEIIANAVKHSGADTIRITLQAGPGLSLSVSDNGRGFDPHGITANGGFTHIRKRCALIDYQAQCTTAPGQGCTWHLSPLPAHGT